jgi:predicted nuclease with TOPRIM domain
MKMNAPIPIEHLKTIWKTFSEVNAQIKKLNEKILSLKDYIDALIPGVDTAEFVTKSQIFKDGDPEKGVENKKEILSQL